MCGWISMTGMGASLAFEPTAVSRIYIDKHLIQSRARRYQFLLQAVGDQGFDAGAVRRHAVGQRIAHQRQEIAIAFVFRAVAVTAPEFPEIRLFGCHEGVHQRTRQPRIVFDVLVLHDNEPMDRVYAAAAKPIRFDLFDVGNQFRIGIRCCCGRAVLVPAADWRTGAADAGRPGKSRLDFSRLHHALERFALRRVHHIRRQLERRDVLLIVDHPRHLCGVEFVLIDEDAARPHPGGHRISAYSDLFAFQVLGHLDACIGTHHEAAVMKAAHQKDRQGNERSAERARDHVSRGCHLADVELHIPDHTPECPDNRHDLDEVRLNACDGNRPVLEGLGMTVAGDGNFQSWPLRHCFSMPAFSITAAHFLTSAAMRSRISSGVLPRASMPSVAAVAWSAGSASAALMCWLSAVSVSAGIPAAAARPFQLVTTYSGKPLSFAVGTSLSNGLRCSPEVAMILTRLSEITACSPA